jgi:hypothetical protein
MQAFSILREKMNQRKSREPVGLSRKEHGLKLGWPKKYTVAMVDGKMERRVSLICGGIE